MRSKFTKQEKYDMVTECRRSGLSDYQWCQRQGIPHSTFYNWTQQLRNFGPELPAPANRDSYSDTTKQDVVKLQVIDDISLPSDLDNSPKNVHSVEYSCAMKSHFRKTGNQLSGSGNHRYSYASLLA